MKPIEIEVHGPHNERLHFRPLQRCIRGEFDLMRVGEPMAKVAAVNWPTPIPSQRLGITADGTGYVVEPLHDPEHAPTREKIEAMGKRLEPDLQEFDNIDLPTWLFWIKRAVQSGIARVVKGALPDKIEGKPRISFILNEKPRTTTDRLAAAIERQSLLMEQLLEKLAE